MIWLDGGIQLRKGDDAAKHNDYHAIADSTQNYFDHNHSAFISARRLASHAIHVVVQSIYMTVQETNRLNSL